MRLPCSVPDCCNPQYVKKLCKRHYHKLLRYGDPNGGRKTRHGERFEWITSVALRTESNDCLIWPFSRSEMGYAVLAFEGWQGYASRHICKLAHGEPPAENMQAAHSCGNGHLGCVNPRHLRWATPRENVADKTMHGTRRFGEDHCIAKLTERDVREIRQSAMTQTALAAKYGVHQATISCIVLRKTWQHVTDA